MKLNSLLLLSCLLLGKGLSAQTVKHFAGKQNENDPNLNYNNATCSIADAYFYQPSGIVWDKGGKMWITERNKIRLLHNNEFYNRAGGFGDGDQSQSFVDGTGPQARFYAPAGIVADANGVLFIADDENHAIRKMGAFVNVGNTQAVSTFAGAVADGNKFGTPGSTNGTGTAARFYNPKGMVLATDGNMYVAEFGNYCVRKVTSSGVVTLLAGNMGKQGTKDGTGASAEFGGPYGIAQLDANYLVVSDFDNGTLRKVHISTGAVTTLCGVAGDNVHADGSFAQARFREPRGLAVVDGKIYVCDGSIIRVVDVNAQTVATFAGSKTATGNQDGEGGNARFGTLGAMAYDGKISLYVTDLYYNVIKTVTINSLAPTVDFSASKTSVIIDETVTLTNTSTGKPATSLTWSVTPGSYSISSGSLTASPLVLKFQVAGFYNVNLDVTNAYGTGSKNKGSFISVSTTGISAVPEKLTVGFYPNPSSDVINLQSLYGNHPMQYFEIADLNGKIMFQRSCANSHSETVDVQALPAGLYIIKVRTSEGLQALKLQKI